MDDREKLRKIDMLSCCGEGASALDDICLEQGDVSVRYGIREESYSGEPEEETSNWFVSPEQQGEQVRVRDMFSMPEGDYAEQYPDIPRDLVPLLPSEREYIDGETYAEMLDHLDSQHPDAEEVSLANLCNPDSELYDPNVHRSRIMSEVPDVMSLSEMVTVCTELRETCKRDPDYNHLSREYIHAAFTRIIKQMPGQEGLREKFTREAVVYAVNLAITGRWTPLKRLDLMVDNYPEELNEKQTERMMLGILAMYTRPVEQKRRLLRMMREDLDEAIVSGLDEKAFPRYDKQRVLALMNQYINDLS